jgi:hypothetical protein
MFTYMTRLGLWRTAVDLHVEELEECINTSVHVLASLMGDTRDLVFQFPPEEASAWIDVSTAWTGHEHALSNYGAVLCQEYSVKTAGTIRPEATWFALQQRKIREAGWLYSRPAWATDIEVLTGHRQKLLKLRPEWYGPKFDMTPREVEGP